MRPLDSVTVPLVILVSPVMKVRLLLPLQSTCESTSMQQEFVL